MKLPSTQNTPKALGEAPDIVIPPFTPGIWDDDIDMVNLRKHITDQIRNTWNEGIDHFIKGEWAEAKTKFQDVLDVTNGDDGPAILLLKVINQHNCISPPNWKGYRALY